MNQRTYNQLTGLLFAVFGLIHAVRFVAGWPFVIGAWEISKWASAIAILVAGFLALAAFRLNRSEAS